MDQMMRERVGCVSGRYLGLGSCWYCCTCFTFFSGRYSLLFSNSAISASIFSASASWNSFECSVVSSWRFSKYLSTLCWSSNCVLVFSWDSSECSYESLGILSGGHDLVNTRGNVVQRLNLVCDSGDVVRGVDFVRTSWDAIGGIDFVRVSGGTVGRLHLVSVSGDSLGGLDGFTELHSDPADPQ